MNNLDINDQGYKELYLKIGDEFFLIPFELVQRYNVKPHTCSPFFGYEICEKDKKLTFTDTNDEYIDNIRQTPEKLIEF